MSAKMGGLPRISGRRRRSDKLHVEESVQEARLEYVPLEELHPAKRNPKRHADEAIQASIQRFGFVAPVILNEKTGRLVAGHGRLAALRSLQANGEDPPARIKVDGDRWLVPVVRGVGFRNRREAEGYLLADNQLTIVGRWDDGQLADILSDQLDLDGLGWDEGEVKALLDVPDFEPDDDGEKALDQTTFERPTIECPKCGHEWQT